MHQAHPEQNDLGDSQQQRPSIAEVVQRLDHLWSEETPELSDFSGDHVGQRIGKYILQRIVGRGSFGVVYQAFDTELEREVALKLPRPEVLIDAERLSRFEGEATTAARLDHPAIVPIFDAQFTGPVPYIASAYCGGPDLGDWLDARKTAVEPRTAAEFVARLTEAVQYAHEQGVLHRDLKPSNIMLESRDSTSSSAGLADYDPRLTDFGLAKLIEASLHDTRSSLLVGTPLYMAPEQLERDSPQVSQTTDVYALGVLLYELLTLKTPFAGESYIEVLDKLRSEQSAEFSAADSDIPTDLRTICCKCLEKQPRDRYASAAELRDDLNRYLCGTPIQAQPSNWVDKFSRWCRRPARIKAAGSFSCGFQLAIVAWLLNVSLVGILTDVFPEGLLRKSLIDITIIAVTFHIPLAYLGWTLSCGKMWAFLPSTLGAIIALAVLLHSSSESAVVFEYNYPTPLSKVNTFVALIMGTSIQVALHLLALPAWKSERDQS